MVDQAIILTIVLALVCVLIFTRISPVRAFAGSLVACYLLGFVHTETVLAKGTNEGVITLVLLLLVSVGLERLPWLVTLSERMLSPSVTRSLLGLSLTTAMFSAFINNTAVVATLASSIRKNKVLSPSRLLLPLSYAAILGGTLTLIGTSTNLIVSSFVQDKTGAPIPFLAFFPVALPALLVGVLTMLLFSWRLPTRSDADDVVNDYLVEAEVQENSPMIGASVEENGLRDLGDLFLVEIVRQQHLITPISPTQRIVAGDKLIFSGDVSRVALLERFQGLKIFALEEGLLRSNMTEVVVRPNAAITGTTLKEASFRSRFDAAVVGIKRDGERLSGKLGNIVIQPGDFLMLATGPDFSQRQNLTRNFLLVNTEVTGRSISNLKSGGFTLLIGVVFALAATGLLDLIKGLCLTLALLLLTGVVNTTELRRRFPWELWLIITSALCLAQAVSDTGAIDALMTSVAPGLTQMPPLALLVVIYLMTLAMTELMTNNAAAALMFPLAWGAGAAAGLDPIPFVMAVAFGASASFLTAHGYTTNLIVQNIGGYQKEDYLRFGVPVSIAYSVTVLVVLPKVFPFG